MRWHKIRVISAQIEFLGGTAVLNEGAAGEMAEGELHLDEGKYGQIAFRTQENRNNQSIG